MNDEQKYRKLLVYEKATTLVVHVYALLKKFPREEQLRYVINCVEP